MVLPVTHSGGKPHTNVGDRGQRYEVRSSGYPKEGLSTVGWAETLEDADEMAAAFRLAPRCLMTEIFDRQEGVPVIKRFAGILR